MGLGDFLDTLRGYVYKLPYGEQAEQFMYNTSPFYAVNKTANATGVISDENYGDLVNNTNRTAAGVGLLYGAYAGGSALYGKFGAAAGEGASGAGEAGIGTESAGAWNTAPAAGGAGAGGAGGGESGGQQTSQNRYRRGGSQQSQEENTPSYQDTDEGDQQKQAREAFDKLYYSRPDLIARGREYYLQMVNQAKALSQTYPPTMAANMAIVQNA